MSVVLMIIQIVTGTEPISNNRFSQSWEMLPEVKDRRGHLVIKGSVY